MSDKELFDFMAHELHQRIRNTDLTFHEYDRGLRSTQVAELLRLLIELGVINRHQVANLFPELPDREGR